MFSDIMTGVQLDWRAAVEILILTVSVYMMLNFVQQAKGTSIIRGLLVVGVVFVVALFLVVKFLTLPNINWILERFIPLLAVTLLIIFQPEIRHALIRLGQQNKLDIFLKHNQSQFIDILSNSAYKLSSRRIGALIAIQREDSLDRYADGGIRVNADVSPDVILSVFWPGSPLHDGGVVISNRKIKAAGCLFPLSENPNIPPAFGTRHRAGVGITEDSDSLAIIVSEETGNVSISVRGHLTSNIKIDDFKSILNELYSEEPSSALEVSKES
ncbi:MAG: diadenylate cyclase CdaA [Candidatus Brocadiia bacterium]